MSIIAIAGTVPSIRNALRGGLITPKEALKHLEPFMKMSHPARADAQKLVDEVLGMPEEPEALPSSVIEALTDRNGEFS